MKWNAAYRSLDELDPTWYRSFDAGSPTCIMSAVEDLAVLDAHGFGVYLAPNQVGKLWMRAFYPATEAGEQSCMWLYPLDKATLTAQFHAHCDRLAGMLQTWPDAARSIVTGPLLEPNVKPDTWARWRRHKPVCEGTWHRPGHEMHEDSLRTLIDVEYNDTLAYGLSLGQQNTSASMEAAFAVAMARATGMARRRPAPNRDVWRAEALGRTRLAACVEWTPDRIETAEGVERASRAYGARDWARMRERSLHALPWHCHALCDREANLQALWGRGIVGVWPEDPYHRCPVSAHVVDTAFVPPTKATWLASLGDGKFGAASYPSRAAALRAQVDEQHDHNVFVAWAHEREQQKGNDNA